MAEKKEKDIKYQLIDHIADLGEPDAKGWGKEVNIICWGNSKNPVIDIRKWNRDSDIMGKGISLSLSDFKSLQKIETDNLEEYFSNESDDEEE